MSWCVNQGPSFDTQRHAYNKLSGFFQRFELQQDDNRMTPGKRAPVPRQETMKGTFKLKPTKRRQKTQVKISDAVPQHQPEPIYSGFGNIKNKATSTIRKKRKPRLKVRKIK